MKWLARFKLLEMLLPFLFFLAFHTFVLPQFREIKMGFLEKLWKTDPGIAQRMTDFWLFRYADWSSHLSDAVNDWWFVVFPVAFLIFQTGVFAWRRQKIPPEVGFMVFSVVTTGLWVLCSLDLFLISTGIAVFLPNFAKFAR